MALIKDLIVLTADKNIQFAVRGILGRHTALGIRQINYDIFVHPERDPGCLRRSDAFLAAFRTSYSRAIVVFDREGCGREGDGRTDLESQVESAIERAGWNVANLAVLVLDPELEVWVWSDSPEVDAALGWRGKAPDLRTWLVRNQYLREGESKPMRPKEAMEAALRQVRRARSSAIFQELAEKVSVERCVDAAFLKLRQVLASWFPAS